MIKEKGKWSGESEQKINFSVYKRVGLENLLGFNFGVVRRQKEWTLGGLTPTYSLNLQGKHYTLSSGYSVRFLRDITSSRLYENLSFFSPGLPNFKLLYSKQDMRDDKEEHRINSTGNNIEFGLEDEIGPFHITFNRQEYSSRNLVRGSRYDTKSSTTSGGVDFNYFYRQLFSFNGRYGIGRLSTVQGVTGETKGKNQDFYLNFRISPIPTIALSGTTVGRQENREEWKRERSNTSLTNNIQLTLQPIKGILLNTNYSKSDTSNDVSGDFSNESRSLMLNFEPWQDFTFSGHFAIYDSREEERRLSVLRRNSFNLNAEPIAGLKISSSLDLSKSTDFVSGFRNNGDNVITKFEATPTENLRTDISYNWERFIRRLGDTAEAETRHQVIFAINYSFARMLRFNFRYNRSIFSKLRESTTFLTCGLNYFRDKSYLNLLYTQISRTFRVEFGHDAGRNGSLRLSYEDRLGRKDFISPYGGMKRISFSLNIRF